MNQSQQIQTKAVPDCIICGSRGKPLYRNLRDRLFGTPGRWSLKRCPNPQCSLVWLDPMPIEDEIGKLYENYYTHAAAPAADRVKNKPRDLLFSCLNMAWSLFLIFTPVYWERKCLFLMHLEKETPGKLLEIGCGDGRRLVALRKLGWRTLGNEIDPASADIARRNFNLEVKSEPLEKLGLAEETFDVIIMNHVIEHLCNPEEFLDVCRKLLKTGGRLVVVTPNVNSIGHKLFGRHWLGLDPPRHLHLFPSMALLDLAQKSGFRQKTVWTSAANAQAFAAGSFDILQKGVHNMSTRPRLTTFIFAVFYQLLASAIHLLNKKAGEECILTAVK